MCLVYMRVWGYVGCWGDIMCLVYMWVWGYVGCWGDIMCLVYMRVSMLYNNIIIHRRTGSLNVMRARYLKMSYKGRQIQKRENTIQTCWRSTTLYRSI